MIPPIAPFVDEKARMRLAMKGARRRLRKARPDAARHAAASFLTHIDDVASRTVALYVAIGDELDPAPLGEALVERGARLALPRVVRKGAPLSFLRYAPGDPLEKDRMGAPAPLPDAPPVTPDIVLAPLLAFDAQGGRLGYGGGYYDRSLRLLRRENPRLLAIGFAYADQEVDRAPTGPLDEPLDAVATERGFIRTRRA